MTDPVPAKPAPADPAALPAATPETATPALPPRKPGLIRRTALIVLAMLLLGAGIAAVFLADGFVRGKLIAALADRGLGLNADAVLEVSVFGGRVQSSNLRVHELPSASAPAQAASSAPVFTADRLELDLAIIDSLLSGDVVIATLAAEGVRGDLRRRGSRVPVIEPTPPGEPGSGWGSLDWLSWAQKAAEWMKQRKDAESAPSAPGATRAVERPAPMTPIDWPRARRFQPAPKPGMRLPRLLIRDLSLKGRDLALPDASSFDITAFTATGSDVSVALEPGETMRVHATFTTRGAGPLRLSVQRTPDGNGTMTMAAMALPLPVLAAPELAGDRIARYRPTGIADATITQTWTGWNLVGKITAEVTGLHLDPLPDAGPEAAKAAQVVNAMKGQPLTWPMAIGGHLYAPTITDSGLDKLLLGSAKTAAVNAATDLATQAAGNALNQGLSKLTGAPSASAASGASTAPAAKPIDVLRGLLPGRK